ncbi:hypothetical protein [Dactylosporangium darangshiense]|uniref:Uncharacterized protein n=1 Tax=Dactylosporangium darangshiense TaxID=579108 RepID=A0ABP8DUT0_9ACTN
MRRNVAQLPDLVALVGRTGGSELRVRNLSHPLADTSPAGAYLETRDSTRRTVVRRDLGRSAYGEFRRRLAGHDPPDVCCALYQGAF